MVQTKYILDGIIQIAGNSAKITQIKRRLSKRDVYYGHFGYSLFVRQEDFNRAALAELIK